MYSIKEHLLLSLPFPESDIQWRVGNTSQDKKKGNALGYIDARLVMERLDEVVGNHNWQSKTRKDGDTYFCELTICGVSKTDGAGATDFEGEKGGSSDAFKRAAVSFGIGRYLYELSDYNTWVELNERKQIVMEEANDKKFNKNLYRAIVNVSKRQINKVLDKIEDKELFNEITNHNLFKGAMVGWNDSDKNDIKKRYLLMKEALGGSDAAAA